MTRLLTLVVVLLAASTSQAKDQRENCNQKAASLSGIERNQFVEQCIRRNAAIKKEEPPMLARMSECNREAGNMTGEPRVRFVNDCLERRN